MAKLDYFQDSGSNYNFSDKLISPNKRVSQFDLSYVNTLTAKQGQIIPVWMSYYYPNDEMDLSIDNLIRVVNPPVVPLLSRQRVFFLIGLPLLSTFVTFPVKFFISCLFSSFHYTY